MVAVCAPPRNLFHEAVPRIADWLLQEDSVWFDPDNCTSSKHHPT